MKKLLSVVVPVALLALLAGAAFAQMGWGQMGPGMGWGQMGPGVMGPGMGWGQMGPGVMGPGTGWGQMGPGTMGGMGGWGGCPGMGGGGAPTTQITDEKAKELAQQYADRYLQGFTVDKILPFTGMGTMTMYSVELKGPKDEVRTLHVNPWGSVMPFGGPWRRSG